MSPLVHYFDYKSPYAYLAQEATYALADQYDVRWLPYTLDIPSFLGAAELDESGRDTLGERNAHQWRRVRYAYMDCRREANRRGLVVRGPRKVFDSSPAHIAFLWASRGGGHPQRFHDAVFERFWRRELDLEDREALVSLLAASGVATEGFAEWLEGEGRMLHDRLREEAHDLGVFGVPSWVVDGELFWGNERLPRVRERLAGATSA